MQDLVVELCRARETHLAAQGETSAARTELADTCRSVGSLLVDSMQRTEQRCVRYTRDDGTVCYARLVPGARRSVALRSADDVVSLLDDVAASVTHVSREDLPAAIARLVETRARSRGAPAPARVRIVPRVGVREQITEHAQAPREVQTLVTQMSDAHAERAQIRETLKPLRARVREAETRLCAAVGPPSGGPPSGGASGAGVAPSRGASVAPPGEVDEVVRMQTETSSRPRAVQVTTELRERRRNIYGIRNVCRCIREAVPDAGERDVDFDARLREAVRRRLAREAEEGRGELTRRVVVRRRKIRP